MNPQPGSNWNNPTNNGFGVKPTPPDTSQLLLSERPTLVGGSGIKNPAPPSKQLRRPLSRPILAAKVILACCAVGTFINLTAVRTPAPERGDFSHSVQYTDCPPPRLKVMEVPGTAPPPSDAQSQTLNLGKLPVKQGKLLLTLMPKSGDGVISALPAASSPVIASSHDGKLLAVALSDYSVGLWDLSTSKMRCTLFDRTSGLFKDDVRSIIFTPNDQTLIVGRYRGTVEYWNLRGERMVHRQQTEDCLNEMALSPDGKLLATGGYSNIQASQCGEIKLWNTRTGMLERTVTQGQPEITGLAFSPDGTTLAATAGYYSQVSMLFLWHLRSRGPSIVRSDSQTWTKGVAFSPDGKMLVTGAIDQIQQTSIASDRPTAPPCYYGGEVIIRDPRTGEPLRSIGCHDQVIGVAFPEGSRTIAALELGPRVEILDLDGRSPELFMASGSSATSQKHIVFDDSLKLMLVQELESPPRLSKLE